MSTVARWRIWDVWYMLCINWIISSTDPFARSIQSGMCDVVGVLPVYIQMTRHVNPHAVWTMCRWEPKGISCINLGLVVAHRNMHWMKIVTRASLLPWSRFLKNTVSTYNDAAFGVRLAGRMNDAANSVNSKELQGGIVPTPLTSTYLRADRMPPHVHIGAWSLGSKWILHISGE